jgi:hypothetical protein
MPNKSIHVMYIFNLVERLSAVIAPYTKHSRKSKTTQKNADGKQIPHSGDEAPLVTLKHLDVLVYTTEPKKNKYKESKYVDAIPLPYLNHPNAPDTLWQQPLSGVVSEKWLTATIIQSVSGVSLSHPTEAIPPRLAVSSTHHLHLGDPDLFPFIFS